MQVPLGVMLFATWVSSFLIPKLLERFGNKIVSPTDHGSPTVPRRSHSDAFLIPETDMARAFQVYVIIALGGAVGAALCLVGNEAINNEDTAFALLVRC